MLKPTHHQPKPIPVGEKEYGLAKLGVRRFDLSDPYHLAIRLSWPGFAAVMLGCWLAINLAFALLYVVSPGDLANARPGSFADAFFFSIETLATVGYGVMAPTTLYGHIVSATEIVAGMTFTAIFTGLLFVRFSRPRAKIVFAEHALINRHATPPTLSLRLANGRVTLMSDATVRLFVLMIQPGQGLRSIQELHLQQSRLPVFVMPWIVSHLIDETSPLHGHDADSLGKADARLLLTIEVRDHVLATMVHDTKAYRISNIRFDMRFAETVTSDGAGHMTGDLSRINLLEPIGAAPPDA